MKIFFSNYHVSVNDCFVDDCLALSHEVVMPKLSFQEQGHINFFAANDEHFGKNGVIPVDYAEFLIMPAMVLIVSCSQMYDDMIKLYNDRGQKDVLVMLSSQPGMGEWVQAKGNWNSEFLISHSLIWHRKSTAKHKILYFNKPKVLVQTKSAEEIKRSFEEQKIKLYINHFETATNYMSPRSFNKEKQSADSFRKLWEQDHNWRIPFYGAENIDGYLSMQETQAHIKDSMFTLAFKGHETWGQMINESMLIGTPCLFVREFIVDMFTEYLINEDTAVVADSVEELYEKVKSMSYEQYEVLCLEARAASEMFTERNNRLQKLHWLFSKTGL